VDSFFANCATSAPSSNSTFAVVVPFPLKQIQNVFSLLYVWSLPDFYPLDSNPDPSLTRRTHLLLYPTTPDAAVIHALRTFMTDTPKVAAMLNNTFGSHQIYSRRLEPRFDLYYRDYLHGHFVASGMNEMFYPMITEIAISLNFDFVLYHEADTFPLRAGWLSKLRDSSFAADSDFWFIGSQRRYKQGFLGRIHGHMNGNCLVRVENMCARNFLARVHKAYRFLPYDTSIMRYLVHQRNLREAQHLMPRMRYTEIIGSFANTEVTREYLLRRYPEMYLVHGRGYYKAMNDLLKFEHVPSGLAVVS
jgi:hypothetical protein